MFQSTPLNQCQLAQLFMSHLKTPTPTEVVKTAEESVQANSCSTDTPSLPSTTLEPSQAPDEMTPVNDGLKWRKYGRKTLRNGGFPRDYYRCTVAGCNAKKQVEKTTDQQGKSILHTTYVGEHTHDTPKFSHFVVRTQEELIDTVLRAFEEMRVQRREGKIEIECTEHVNCLDDGYAWRKYGQKKVEQRSDGTRVNTYEGCHNHAPDSLTQDNENDLKRYKKDTTPTGCSSSNSKMNSSIPRISLMDDIPVLSAAERSSLDVTTRESYDISTQFMSYTKLYDGSLSPAFFYSGVGSTPPCVSLPPPVTVLSQGH